MNSESYFSATDSLFYAVATGTRLEDLHKLTLDGFSKGSLPPEGIIRKHYDTFKSPRVLKDFKTGLMRFAGQKILDYQTVLPETYNGVHKCDQAEVSFNIQKSRGLLMKEQVQNIQLLQKHNSYFSLDEKAHNATAINLERYYHPLLGRIEAGALNMVTDSDGNHIIDIKSSQTLQEKIILTPLRYTVYAFDQTQRGTYFETWDNYVKSIDGKPYTYANTLDELVANTY